MVKKSTLKSRIKNTILNEFAKRELSVDRIVLFGSYVKGTNKQDSDIDLIIISRDFRKRDIFERIKDTSGLGLKLVSTFDLPFDLLFYSDKEWEKGHSIIINEAKKEGEEIYSHI